MTDTTAVPAVPADPSALTAPSGSADESGLSRRRILTGAAWATPAVLIATAAPALAASLPLGSLVVYQLTATQRANQNTNAGAVKALAIAFRIQNQGNEIETVTSATLTWVVPGAASPGSPNYGWVYTSGAWTVTTSASGSDVIVVATYSGSLGAWGDAGGELWVELKSNTNLIGQSVTVSGTGATSNPPRTFTAVPATATIV